MLKGTVQNTTERVNTQRLMTCRYAVLFTVCAMDKSNAITNT